MEKVTHRPQTPAVSRRTLLGAAAAVAGGASGVLGWTAADAATAREVEALKAEGWEAHPCACMMCGGYCGLLAMHKKGAPVSQETVRIMPNPTHPQRGCCARGASAMWVWNHPLRLKKPLKRVGERGEGKFKEVTWDEALDDIAARVKKIVETDGERAVSMTKPQLHGPSEVVRVCFGHPKHHQPLFYLQFSFHCRTPHGFRQGL